MQEPDFVLYYFRVDAVTADLGRREYLEQAQSLSSLEIT